MGASLRSFTAESCENPENSVGSALVQLPTEFPRFPQDLSVCRLYSLPPREVRMFNGIFIGRGRRLGTAGFLMAIAGLLVSGSVKSGAVAFSDAVMEWNQIALAATVTAGQAPVPQ